MTLLDEQLMGDVSHAAGMAATGIYPNPGRLAHVTTFTTQKTICGPQDATEKFHQLGRYRGEREHDPRRHET